MKAKDTDPQITEKIAGLEHRMKIANAMAPDPKEWSYNGTCYEVEGPILEECACGHAIRNVFVVERERDGARVKIGSTCIETTIPYLIANGAEVLAQSLSKAQEELTACIKKRQKELRDSEASVVVQGLLWDYEALIQYVRDERDRYKSIGVRMPIAIYYGVRPIPKACTTPGRTAASIRTRYVAEWLNLVGDYVRSMERGGNPMKQPPAPLDKSLLRGIEKYYRERMNNGYHAPEHYLQFLRLIGVDS